MVKIPDKMKAMMLTEYNKLELATVPVPKPGKGEVLCRIRSVALCGSDPKMIEGGYKFANWPPYFPFIMGHEWAGEVVALGEGVEDLKSEIELQVKHMQDVVFAIIVSVDIIPSA